MLQDGELLGVGRLFLLCLVWQYGTMVNITLSRYCNPRIVPSSATATRISYKTNARSIWPKRTSDIPERWWWQVALLATSTMH